MGRARSLSEWHPDLPSILEKEFQQILEGENPAEGPLRIFTLEEKASLLAMGLVRLEPQKQYAVLEDLVVNRHVRGKKLGSKMVLWLFEQARPLGLKRIFLESGVHNQTAHDFFETLGFRPCSTVFAKDVDPC
jgi:N-acetylglutamate synthase-like GNAT family acetyltransferase